MRGKINSRFVLILCGLIFASGATGMAKELFPNIRNNNAAPRSSADLFSARTAMGTRNSDDGAANLHRNGGTYSTGFSFLTLLKQVFIFVICALLVSLTTVNIISYLNAGGQSDSNPKAW
ncbi:MAG: hypothetical protein ABI615_05825 [Chthoniobacterales bacterium]